MTKLTWVNGQDIEARRDEDGVERLYVDGQMIPLTDMHHHATQQVINYCMAGKRAQKQLRAMWAELAANQE